MPLSPSGFIANPFDPRDVFEDELGGVVATEPLPERYRTEGLTFEPQGAWPLCVSMSVTKMVEQYLKTKQHIVWDLSQPHLFFNAGGSLFGSNFRANLEIAKNKGLITHASFPMPTDLYDLSDFDQMKDRAREPYTFHDAKKILGYVRVNPDTESLKRAVMKYGAVMVGVYAGGGYWNPNTKRQGDTDNHATLLVGWDKDSWILFDSLQPRGDFDGYHKVSKEYTFWSAYAVTELPENWREIRDEAREAPPNNANRYGKPRDYQAEVEFAAKMVVEFKKFNNQSVFEAAGRFWELYCRAGVYGGYNLSYFKWGMWKPGDLVNDCYHWRRTGEHIFDFDKTRI